MNTESVIREVESRYVCYDKVREMQARYGLSQQDVIAAWEKARREMLMLSNTGVISDDAMREIISKHFIERAREAALSRQQLVSEGWWERFRRWLWC